MELTQLKDAKNELDQLKNEHRTQGEELERLRDTKSKLDQLQDEFSDRGRELQDAKSELDGFKDKEATLQPS